MKPTMAILERLESNSKNNHDQIFTRVFRYLLRPEIYFMAYKKLYANKGSATKGVNDDTADKFSEKYIAEIIENLKNETYKPNPTRRIHIEKSNGKTRPLGIPTFKDKLIQEAIRMILEAIYDPIFSRNSHGFRPKRSCHTALLQIKKDFTGVKWFIEGDIKGCFDNIDHKILIKTIQKKIKDARFIKLIYSFLKAGYLEGWKYKETFSGTPQGGILSPILANIYLNKLDMFINKLKKDFDFLIPKSMHTPEYQRIMNKRLKLNAKIKKCENEQRQELIQTYKDLTKEVFKIPAKLCIDKKIKYVRYADDTLLGINGTKMECEQIKEKISEFISNELKMELNQEKTLITHSNTYARFLGYDIRVRRNSEVRPKGKGGFKARTLNNKVELSIPFADKIEKFLFLHGIVEQRKDNGKLEPCRRKNLNYLTELEIVSSYNAELRGMCNYYNLAVNFNKLIYFNYLMEYSCLKTLANKHKSKVSKIISKYKDCKGKWAIPYETKEGAKRLYFADYRDCKGKICKDIIPKNARNHSNNTTTFESRLKAKVCELCGSTDSENFEIHHVNKVKNLKGKQKWEKIMIAKRRKTLVVCHNCHVTIHHGKKKN